MECSSFRQNSTQFFSSTTSQKLKVLNSCIRLWPSSSNTINSSSNYDRENATAIGHIAQAVQILSIILAIPLRYPLICRASKSYIVENLGGNNLSADRGLRMLALFRQTSAQEELFFYAVNLLNADLIQIRLLFESTSYCNIDHSDLLVNLKWIFDFFSK